MSTLQMIDNTQITNYLQVMCKEWENDTEIYHVVSVICRSSLIHVEVEFKFSLAPLSRHGLIVQELTQYLDSTSVGLAASARWTRTPHNQHRGSPQSSRRARWRQHPSRLGGSNL
jgi:hypothetical protein